MGNKGSHKTDCSTCETRHQGGFISAVEHGHLKCVEKLTQARVDKEDKSLENTALLKASLCGHDKCVDLLIKAGADVNSRGLLGCTPLMWAAQKGHIKCMSVLIHARADVNEQDKMVSHL